MQPLLPTYDPLAANTSVEEGTKLVVFIDDLDRVQPDKVVDVLAAVNLILTASGITAVIGMVIADFGQQPDSWVAASMCSRSTQPIECSAVCWHKCRGVVVCKMPNP